ncbi:ABC transporter substrate-binding protein [Promicromonospora sp. NPDC090134]|uniref:ABC transporter substrate-binding protein n=1 Tax=Promicromonospora sp. NPDC090134 TaxID=3364408 RepID=UPI00380F169E
MELSRRSFLTAMGLGTATVMAGCATTSGSGAPAADVTGPAEGDITFLCALFEGATGKETLEGKLLKQFNEKYPDVNVTVDYTDYGSLNEKITTGLASGLMPDVVTLGVGWIPPFAYKNAIAPLPESLATRYTYEERVLEPSRFDGKLYALPMVLDTRIVAYRKDFFEEAGITAPPKDWAELREVAKELTVRDADGTLQRAGFDPFSIDLRQCWETFLFGNSGELFSADGREVLFDGPEGVAALQLFLDMVADGSADFALTTEAGQPTTLQQGTSAIMMTNNSLYVQLQQQNPELIDKVGTFVLGNTGPAMLQGGTMISQSASSKNPAAARALVEFLGSPDAVLVASEQRGSVPAISDLRDSDYVKGNPMVAFALENLDKARSEGGTPAWMEIREKIKPTLETAVVGQQTAEQAIAQLAGIADDAIARL